MKTVFTVLLTFVSTVLLIGSQSWAGSPLGNVTSEDPSQVVTVEMAKSYPKQVIKCYLINE